MDKGRTSNPKIAGSSPAGGVSAIPVLYLWLRAGGAVRALRDGDMYVWPLPQNEQRVFVGGQDQLATSWRNCAARPRVARKYRAIGTLTAAREKSYL